MEIYKSWTQFQKEKREIKKGLWLSTSWLHLNSNSWLSSFFLRMSTKQDLCYLCLELFVIHSGYQTGIQHEVNAEIFLATWALTSSFTILTSSLFFSKWNRQDILHLPSFFLISCSLTHTFISTQQNRFNETGRWLKREIRSTLGWRANRTINHTSCTRFSRL